MSHHQEKTWKYFENNPLTHSAAHYLMTINDLRKEHGYARITDIAKHLNITAGSCSLKMKSLKKKGLVEEDKNRFLLLSEEGKKWVDLVEKNDHLFETFFRTILGVSPKQSEIDACKIEHLISPETSQKLCDFLKYCQNNDDFIEKFHQEPENECCTRCTGECTRSVNVRFDS
jgi:DtxR family Mn-dependent transcriptional regulator